VDHGHAKQRPARLRLFDVARDFSLGHVGIVFKSRAAIGSPDSAPRHTPLKVTTAPISTRPRVSFARLPRPRRNPRVAGGWSFILRSSAERRQFRERRRSPYQTVRARGRWPAGLLWIFKRMGIFSA
jgi:hypothetical protein